MTAPTIERPSTAAREGDLPMPPSRQGDNETRVNLGARVRTETRRRAKLFSAVHDLDMQDLVDAALDEYMSRRGG